MRVLGRSLFTSLSLVSSILPAQHAAAFLSPLPFGATPRPLVPGPRPAASRARHLATMPPLRMGVATEGQDLKELFDLYEAPGEEFARSGVPTKLGLNKERGLVHRDGDWHRAIHVWLYTPSGELVLQKRSEKKDTFPGKWDVSVGGHVTSGEGVMHTAIKESEEELGVKVAEADLESLGTIATSLKGSSPKQGAFQCNEYKDLFLLRFGGRLEDLDFADNEVEAVDLKGWRDVEADMRKQLSPEGVELDGPYVPRPQQYIDILFGALRTKFEK